MVVTVLKSSSQLLLPPKKFSYSDYLVDFELFYRNIDNLNILSKNNLVYLKAKIKDLALTFFCNNNANISHVSTEEFEALKNLSKNYNLVIQKADKSNSVFLVKKDIYIRNIEKLNDIDHVKYINQ